MSLLLQALQKASRQRERSGAPHAQAPAGPRASAPRETGLGEPALGVGIDDAGVGEPGLSESALRESAFGEPTLSEASDSTGDPPLSLADADALFAPEPDPAPDLAPAPRTSEMSAPPLRPIARPIERTVERPGERPDERTVPRSAAASIGSAHSATILRASEARRTGMLDHVRDRPVHAALAFALVFGVFYGGYLYLAINYPGVLRGEFPWSGQPRRAPLNPPPARLQPAPPTNAMSIIASAPTSAATGASPGAQPVDTATQASGPRHAEQPLAGMPPASAAPATSTPTARHTRPQRDSFEQPAPRASRRRAPAARTVPVEVDSTTFEDSVAVRPPPAAPALPGRILMQAWEALQQGHHEEARRLYQRALQADAQSVDALLGLAALAARDANPEEAGRAYARALEIEPHNSTAQAGLISIIGQADPQQSETRLKQLLAREPSALVYFALGNLYARQNLWAQAQPAFFRAYEAQPDNPDYAYNLAVGLEHLGQPRIALNYYRRALELSSLKGHAGFDQASVQERIGQLKARVGSGR